MRGKRWHFVWATGISLCIHLLIFFYPALEWQNNGDADNGNDVLSRHKGGKVPKVHLHLQTASSTVAEQRAPLHIFRLPDNWQPVTISAPPAPSVQSHAVAKPAALAARHAQLHKAKRAKTHHHPALVAATDIPALPTAPALPDNPPPLATSAEVTAPPAAAPVQTAAAVPPAPPLTVEPPEKPQPAAIAPHSTAASATAASATAADATAAAAQPSTLLTAPAQQNDAEFPHDLQALYHIRVGLAIPVGVDALEHWHISGNHYQLQLDAHKFGFHARILSVGGISDQGLTPDTFTVQLNQKTKIESHFSYADHTLTQGHPNQLKTFAFSDGAQDMFSFAYELALIFAGHDQMEMTVTNGTSLYHLQFKVLGEEVLQLPAGKIKTLHLQGSRQMLGSNEIQSGYEAWLAPDFSNFPVKMSGPDSAGKQFVLILKALAFEGKPLFGKLQDTDRPVAATTVPDDLQQFSEAALNDNKRPTPADAPTDAPAK